MANVKSYKTLEFLSGGPEWVQFLYDFSVDGGAIGSLTLGTVAGETVDGLVLVDGFTEVLTAAVGVNGTLILGVTGSTSAILASTNVTGLGIGVVKPGDAACRMIKMANNDSVLMAIGTTAWTAGKFKVNLLMKKFGG